MNKKRPVNLDIQTIKLPLPGVTSILHRISGVALFFGAIFALYLLSLSLDSQSGFDAAADLLRDSFLAKLIAWGFVSALLYHLVAGIKHLIMDLGYFEELESGTLAAKVTLILGGVLVLLAGVWIW
ncbi:succinate dehydrogenase, cytochrome b556 subunit [Nitrincola sp.]|uniref:succinate dehydrogenase, cytochrome b556 subunit n=1 Tax=Nitrincola sp. TaxID=1926584 RepID=UPI003A93509A